MSQIYVVNSDGSTRTMNRVQCKSEDAELQRLLEKNHDLLPGDQIDPEAPRRWLLIRREMPVPSPASGVNQWSIDFLFADQDAIPTFVECKRFNDTRARREVVGQVLEYVANGQHYWTREEMQSHAESAALSRSTDLSTALNELQSKLQPDERLGPSDFFTKVEANLREAQVRIVFFLEQSSMELRSLVEFLNKQLQRTEVLLVEAKQFPLDSTVVVAPNLFGYTEQARLLKESGRVNTTPRVREKWDSDSFDAALESNLEPGQAAAVRKLVNFANDSRFRSKYGSGKQATFTIYHPKLAPTSNFLGVYASGKLWLGFSSLNKSEEARQLRDHLAQCASNRLGLTLPDNFETYWPEFPISDWAPRVEELLTVLKEIEIDC